MKCPLCKKELDKAIFFGVEVDYCTECLGIWFEKDELRLAKDEREDKLKWLDVDLWDKEDELGTKRGEKLCPSCRLAMYEVGYGESEIKVDICKKCKGIWLDRGEFNKIIGYLKEKEDYEVLNNYSKNLIREFWEIFSGPESFREEVVDFIIILKLFNYKFVEKYPYISNLLSNLPT